MPGFVTKQSVAVTRLVVHSVPLFFPFQRPPPFAKALTGRTHTSGFIHEVDRENTFYRLHCSFGVEEVVT